jgi:hypothetical protein
MSIDPGPWSSKPLDGPTMQLPTAVRRAYAAYFLGSHVRHMAGFMQSACCGVRVVRRGLPARARAPFHWHEGTLFFPTCTVGLSGVAAVQ